MKRALVALSVLIGLWVAGSTVYPGVASAWCGTPQAEPTCPTTTHPSTTVRATTTTHATTTTVKATTTTAAATTTTAAAATTTTVEATTTVPVTDPVTTTTGAVEATTEVSRAVLTTPAAVTSTTLCSEIDTSGECLPATGSATTGLVAVALVCLLAGFGMVYVARRQPG